MKKDKTPKGRILFCYSVRAAARLGKYALIGDWIAVGGSAALRISHALWVNNLSPLSVLPIFLQGLVSSGKIQGPLKACSFVFMVRPV